MSESIKFTEEELKKVNELQGTYLQLQNSLGQISVGRIRLEQQSDEFEAAEENVRKRFKETQQQEKDFIQVINKKYGDGNLDIASGIFTPNPKEETVENK
tara:strand:- start:2245 stop:2544 length:300 start_codon:yes stop_codon:yes gene_type:complete